MSGVDLALSRTTQKLSRFLLIKKSGDLLMQEATIILGMSHSPQDGLHTIWIILAAPQQIKQAYLRSACTRFEAAKVLCFLVRTKNNDHIFRKYCISPASLLIYVNPASKKVLLSTQQMPGRQNDCGTERMLCAAIMLLAAESQPTMPNMGEMVWVTCDKKV